MSDWALRHAAEIGWNAAVAAMKYEDGTPVEIVTMVNPYACPCGCPADVHVGDIGCPCGLPDEPPCTPASVPTPGSVTTAHTHRKATP